MLDFCAMSLCMMKWLFIYIYGINIHHCSECGLKQKWKDASHSAVKKNIDVNEKQWFETNMFQLQRKLDTLQNLKLGR